MHVYISVCVLVYDLNLYFFEIYVHDLFTRIVNKITLLRGGTSVALQTYKFGGLKRTLVVSC